ncbi:ATP-grasp domain-containing protein [Streptomyces sp. NPDC050732]|uniref:ATP-grasp domain-containing protein n=1 Tax=Streptomyces sp. NPDC050732 TaxID=3154632 RepID=UPI00342B5585
MTGIGNAFVQVGAARDGLDPYLDCARRRDMPAVLVETPAYLSWRRALRRKPFDAELAVRAPEDPAQVAAALSAAGVAPALVLAGFDRYTESALRLAATAHVRPWPHVGTSFRAPDKAGQRAALSRHAPTVRQPKYAQVTADETWSALRELSFPQVVKPVDGGGGLGVHLVGDEAERDRALHRIGAAANFGGAAFADVLVEEQVVGNEYSLQCLAWEGKAHLLSMCEKVVLTEEDGESRGFRECGHMATAGDNAPLRFRELAQWCAEATGYREGPFHIDLIDTAEGPYFLEMGFRLSGFGLVSFVEYATGLDWAERVFTAHADRQEPVAPACDPPHRTVAQLVATRPQQLAIGRAWAACDPRVSVTAAPATPDLRLFTASDLAALAADRERHATILGTVRMEDVRTDRLRDRLRYCATGGRR